jgi:hypothetical protein
MSDGREERKEQEERRKWAERDDRDDVIERRWDRERSRDWEPERRDS